MTDTSQQNRSRNPRAERAERIKAIFRARARELAGLFPRDGMTMVARAVETARMVSMNLDLDITAESIAEAAIACHHLGLEVGDQAYIYPHQKGQAKLTIGPRGLIALAYRSGEIKSIRACSVFKGDDFTYDLGDDSIHHVKAVTGRRPRNHSPESLITHTWARVETRSEGTILEVLTAEDIAFYRAFSKAKRDDGPWFVNFEGMARKTVIKRVLEFVPRSPLLAAALSESEEGAYEIPEEIMEAMRARQGNGKASAQPEPEPAMVDGTGGVSQAEAS
jgi:recombination protein RecT